MEMNFAIIKEAVARARSTAHRTAKKQGRFTNCNFVRSRGTLLATFNQKDGQCMPNIEAECPGWNGTKKEITALVAECTTQYPGVEEIYIAGAYDMSDRMDFDDYEPRVSEWSVTIWTSADGYIEPRVSTDDGIEYMRTDRYGNIIATSRQ